MPPSTSIELEAVRKDAIESKAKVHGGGKDDFGYGGEAVDILYQGLSSAQPIRPQLPTAIQPGAVEMGSIGWMISLPMSLRRLARSRKTMFPLVFPLGWPVALPVS